jgi:hypothetical protein
MIELARSKLEFVGEKIRWNFGDFAWEKSIGSEYHTSLDVYHSSIGDYHVF